MLRVHIVILKSNRCQKLESIFPSVHALCFIEPEWVWCISNYTFSSQQKKNVWLNCYHYKLFKSLRSNVSIQLALFENTKGMKIIELHVLFERDIYLLCNKVLCDTHEILFCILIKILAAHITYKWAQEVVISSL